MDCCLDYPNVFLLIVPFVFALSFHKTPRLSTSSRFFVPKQNNKVDQSQYAEYVPNGVVCR